MSQEAEVLRLRQWTLMYVGGVVSLSFCVYIVYIVTASGDPSIEWVFWIFFGLTIALIGGGYYLESDHKRRHGDPCLSDYEELFKQEG